MFDNSKDIQHIQAGSLLLQEGQQGNSVYIILKGHVKVTRSSKNNQEILLAELSEGQVFGEMSLIDDSVCSANVTAINDITVRALNKEQFFNLLQTDISSVQSVMEILFQRMRAMNKRVMELENQLLSQADPTHEIIIQGLTEPAKHALYDMNARVVDDNPFMIGRWSKQQSKKSWFSKSNTRNHIEIHDIPPYVISRQHCHIERNNGGVFIVDTASRLGTWVNGNKIDPQHQKEIKLNSGSNTVHLGGLDSQFVFEVHVP